MILVSLSGGIGNQLFQYAAGRSLAINKNTSLVLDTSWYQVDQNKLTPRNVDIFKFKLSDNLVDIRSLALSRIARVAFATRALLPVPRWQFAPFFERKSFVFDPTFFMLPKNVFLNGYWQSWKYFENIGPVLARELTASFPLSSTDLSVLKRIQKVNSVGVHVRRGDYVKSAMLLCNVGYYSAGAEKIKEITGHMDELTFFLFSRMILNGRRITYSSQVMSST